MASNSHHPLAFYLLRFISATISLENSNYFYSSLYYIGRSHLSTLIVYSIGDKQYAYSNFFCRFNRINMCSLPYIDDSMPAPNKPCLISAPACKAAEASEP